MVQNSDPHLRFDLQFRTLPTDSTGVFHKLEHAVITDSPNLPVPDVFFEATRSLLLTTVNASTGAGETGYYATGIDPESLKTMARIFTDSTLKGCPSRETYLREHGHLVPDSSQPCGFRFKGIVYDEMVGVFADDSRFRSEAYNKAVFADGPFRHCSGGDPVEMLDLTEKEYAAKYRDAYHASKAVFGLYGNLELEAKLEFLNELLLGRTRGGGDISQLPLPEAAPLPREVVARVPFNEESAAQPIEKQYALRLGWKFPRPHEPQERMELMLLAYLLGAIEGFPLEMLLREANTGSHYAGSTLYLFGNENLLTLAFANGTKDEITRSKETALRILQDLAKNGFERGVIDAALTVDELHHRQNLMKTNRGDEILNDAISRVFYEDYQSSQSYFDQIRVLREKIAAGVPVFQDLLKKYVINNSDQTVFISQPCPIIRQEWRDAQAKKIANMVARLDAAGIEKVQRDAQHMRDFDNKLRSTDSLSQMPIAALPEQYRRHIPVPIDVAQYEGATITHQPQDTGHDATINISFDVSNLTPHELSMVEFLAIFMSKRGPVESAQGEFVQQLQRVSTGIQSLMETHGIQQGNWKRAQAARSFVTFRTTVGPAHHQQLLSLVSEMIRQPELSDLAFLKHRVESIASNCASCLSHPNTLTSLTRDRLAALNSSLDLTRFCFTPEAALGTLAYFRERLQNDPDGFVAELQGLHKRVFHRNALTVSTTVNEVDWSYLEPQMRAFVASLPEGTPVKPALVERYSSSAIGLSAALNNNYVGCAVTVNDQLGQAWSQRGIAEVAHKIMDRYLNDEIRVRGGAYGGSGYFNSESGLASFQSWQDPNISDTLAAFRAAVTFLRSNTTDDLLARAKVAAINSYEKPMSAVASGDLARNRFFRLTTGAQLDQVREEIIDASIEDILRYADALERGFASNLSIVVYGNADAFERARKEGVNLKLVKRV